jgi:YceI-like domain
MTKRTLTGLAMLALAAAFLPATTFAQDGAPAVRLAVRNDSRLWIEGTSNLHSWSCKATTLDAAIEVDSSWMLAAGSEGVDYPKLVRRVEVKVPVEGLKCGNGKMDRIMYDALKVGAAPDISYILGSFEAVPGEARDTFVFRAAGTLKVAGKENPIRIEVRTERLADGTVRAESAVPILMTDYGVKPPRALLGTLRTGNNLTVKFELFVAPQPMTTIAGGTQR